MDDDMDIFVLAWIEYIRSLHGDEYAKQIEECYYQALSDDGKDDGIETPQDYYGVYGSHEHEEEEIYSPDDYYRKEKDPYDLLIEKEMEQFVKKENMVARHKVTGKIILQGEYTRAEFVKMMKFYFDYVKPSKDSDYTYYVK
jgi:hypothetical protein